MSPGLLKALVEALLSAGASAKAITAMMAAYEIWARAKRPTGQPRKYADTEARSRAYREKRKKPAPETRPRLRATESRACPPALAPVRACDSCRRAIHHFVGGVRGIDH